MSWLFPGVLYLLDMPERPPEGFFQGHPLQISEPPQLVLLDVEDLLQAPGRALHLISKGAPCHPLQEINFGCLCPTSCSFSHNLNFMAREEGRNIVVMSAQFLLYHGGLISQPHYCSFCTDLSLSCSMLPSIDNKIPRYLNSSTWDRGYELTWREYANFFLAKILLEVLILIPAA